MNWLYLALNLGSISIPLIYSFHPKMNFIRHWKSILVSTSITAVLFLIWDAWFTSMEIWGFNPKYYLGPTLIDMPVEEWLFFFCIPYASIFIHYSLEFYLPSTRITSNQTRLITFIAFTLSLILCLTHFDRWYTFINFGLLSILLAYAFFREIEILRRFYLAFIIILVPFFIVNGILTGTGIEDQVIWYNNHENLNIRIGTIPVEDIGYAFSMLFLNILIFEKIK